MAEPGERQATYRDLLRVPAHFVAEIVNGRLVTHPRPAPRHLRASSSLGGVLDGPFDKGRVRAGPGLGLRSLAPRNGHRRSCREAADLCGTERAHIWLIDPQLRILEVFENNAGKWHLLTTLNDQDRGSRSRRSTPSHSIYRCCGQTEGPFFKRPAHIFSVRDRRSLKLFMPVPPETPVPGRCGYCR